MNTFSSIGKVFTSAKTAQTLGNIGTVVTGVGQLIQAKEQGEVGEYNAQVYQQKASAEKSSQALLEMQKRKIYESRIGEQVSIYASSGIKMTGSPIEVLADSLENAELDLAIDRYNSNVAQQSAESQAQMQRLEADRNKRLSHARASSTFLSLASDLYRQNREPLGIRGQELGAGTTTYGVKVPSRYIPAR